MLIRLTAQATPTLGRRRRPAGLWGVTSGPMWAWLELSIKLTRDQGNVLLDVRNRPAPSRDRPSRWCHAPPGAPVQYTVSADAGISTACRCAKHCPRPLSLTGQSSSSAEQIQGGPKHKLRTLSAHAIDRVARDAVFFCTFCSLKQSSIDDSRWAMNVQSHEPIDVENLVHVTLGHAFN